MNTGFSTEPMSEKNINTFLSNVKISRLTEEPEKKGIECFDVNESGDIAIGCNSHFEQKTVCIYSSDGAFQYGYRFECSGSFGIELEQDALMMYFVRGDVAVALDSMGNVVSIAEIQNTSENNTYWNKTIYATRRQVGDTEYVVKNDMGLFHLFASSYSQLIMIHANGEEQMVYDVNATQLIKMVVGFTLCLVFVGIVVVGLVREFRKTKRGT